MSPRVEIIYRQANLEEIYRLRVGVLRPGQGELKFANDDAAAPATWHFGAFLAAPEAIACVTYLSSSHDGAAALQLRGMAVDERYRNQGIGGRLIEYAEGIVRLNGPGVLWCNARLRAVAFYERHGWRCISKEFAVEGVGVHRVMLKGV